MEDSFLRNIIGRIAAESDSIISDRAEQIKTEFKNKQINELSQVFFEVYWRAPEKLDEVKKIINETSLDWDFNNYLRDYNKYFPDIPIDPPAKKNYIPGEIMDDFDDGLKYFSGHPIFLPNGDFVLEDGSVIRYFKKNEDGWDELKNGGYKYSSARRPLEYRYYNDHYYLVINAQTLVMVKYDQSENESLRKTLQGIKDDYPTRKLDGFCDARVCPDGKIMVLGFDRIDYLSFDQDNKTIEIVESYPMATEKILNGKILPGNRIIYSRMPKETSSDSRLILAKFNLAEGEIETVSEEVTDLDETLQEDPTEKAVDYKNIYANGNRVLVTTKMLDKVASRLTLGREEAAVFKREDNQWRMEIKRKGVISAQIYPGGRLLSHTNILLGTNEFALENLNDGSKEVLPLGGGKPKFAMGLDGRILCINDGKVTVYDGEVVNE